MGRAVHWRKGRCLSTRQGGGEPTDDKDSADCGGPSVVVCVDSQCDKEAPFAGNRTGEGQLKLPELLVRKNGVKRPPGLAELPPKLAHGAENRRFACLFKETMEDMWAVERLDG